jgi:Protein of unknown function (DUF4240)
VDQDRFWELVEAAGAVAGGNCETQAIQLAAMLEQLPAEEIIAFERHSVRLLDEADRWDLWGAAYQINSGCSDDGFVYFRGWLLTQGRAIWEAALDDPDSLATHPAVATGDALECEDILYVASVAYQARTGEDILYVASVAYQARTGKELDRGQVDEDLAGATRPRGTHGTSKMTTSSAGAFPGCRRGLADDALCPGRLVTAA